MDNYNEIIENTFLKLMAVYYSTKLDYETALKQSCEMVKVMFKKPETKALAEVFVEKKLQELEPDYSTSRGSN